MQVGIIGGGQLAMMLCQAAAELGLKTAVLDPNPTCSAAHFTDLFICSSYDDERCLDRLAQLCDVVTYEFENVSSSGIDIIDNKYHNVVQTSLPLKLANDRLYEKQMAAASGFEPAPFADIKNNCELEQFIDQYQLPVVIKTRRFGYDGKGQFVITDQEQLSSDEVASIINSGAIAEKMIDLDYETSVIAVRNKLGVTKFIPSTINTHRNNILYTTETIDAELDSRITEYVTKYLEYHNLIGIITVEVFISKDDKIYFNEIAPRPHNSGHYSIEGCDHSQFEMHLRAICGMDLPESKVVDKTVMINVLGQDYERAKQFIKDTDCNQLYFHDYFKPEAKQDRKMAHITAVGEQAIELLKAYQL